jgi:hypothetical protein
MMRRERRLTRAFILSALLVSATTVGCGQPAHRAPSSAGPPAATDGRSTDAAAEHAARLCRGWADAHRVVFSSTNGMTATGAISFLRQLRAPSVQWLSRVPPDEFAAVCVETQDSTGMCIGGGPAGDFEFVVLDDKRHQSAVHLRRMGGTPCPTPTG